MNELNNTAPPKGSGKGVPTNLIATAIVLAGILIFVVFMYFTQKHKMAEMEATLTEEKDSLANELRMMVVRYDTLRTNNDSLNAGLEREKTRIVQLLALNASNAQLIKKYKAEISTMREIMKSYIVQIDSLNTRNKILRAQNTEIQQQMDQVKTTNTELSKAREELSSKVELASVIQAKDVVASILNKKRKETTRLSLLDKLRVCFTLRENPIASAGEKEVYLRVLRPDSLVIATNNQNMFDYKGNKIVYSASRAVDYMNQDVDVCIYLDNTGDFVTGNYSVELYTEGNLIGRTSFAIPRN